MTEIESDSRGIGITEIEIPSALYPRTFLPQEKDVQHLIGVSFPPIVVAELPPTEELETTRFVLVDGAHRIKAAECMNQANIEAEILTGLDEADILREAIKRNAAHGKQLSMGDKQKAAATLVAEGWKVKGLVSLLSVGERTISRWVSEAKEAKKLTDYAKVKKLVDKGASVAAAAKEVGVPRTTAKGWLDSPPTARPKARAPKQEELRTADPEKAKKAVGQDRIDAVAEMVVEFAKDSAKELDDKAKGGAYSPHWCELTEAAFKAIRKQYPKGWK